MDASTPLPDREDDKARWRAWARDVRRHRDPAAIASESDAVAAHLEAWDVFAQARHVLTYLPMPDELDLRGLLGMPGKTWHVTRTWPQPERPLSVHVYRAEELERHRYGFQQPVATAEPSDPTQIDLALVPGLAFDAVGTRLGHGLGYYDRLLSEVPRAVVRVGVALEGSLVPRLPRDAHDAAMDYLVTASGIRAVASPD